MKIRFLGHASFIIEDAKGSIAIDPYDITLNEKVDYIFVTHSHYDHCSPEDIEKLTDPNKTTIVATKDCKEKIEGISPRIILVEPNKTYNAGIDFKTLPAYNIEKPFHPRDNNWVGYIIKLENSVYHPGDTDLIPEMAGLEPDYFLVPIGGTYTMDVKEGAKAVKTVNPKYAIPMHYGKIVGSTKDAEEFKKIYKENHEGDTEILILKPEQ